MCNTRPYTLDGARFALLDTFPGISVFYCCLMFDVATAAAAAAAAVALWVFVHSLALTAGEEMIPASTQQPLWYGTAILLPEKQQQQCLMLRLLLLLLLLSPINSVCVHSLALTAGEQIDTSFDAAAAAAATAVVWYSITTAREAAAAAAAVLPTAATMQQQQQQQQTN